MSHNYNASGVTATDLNGQELILDADADTSITADSDDQIDIKISGADDFRFTANSFNVLSGSTLTIDSGATIANSGTASGFGGSSRYAVTYRFRISLGSTSNVYFSDDPDSSANQFYVAKGIAQADPLAVDSDWLSGFEAGPQWQAPRDCTLTQIAATSRLNVNAGCTAMRIHVYKGTPLNNNPATTDIDMELIGSADLDDGAGTPGVLTDAELQFVNDTISSGNEVSAADCILIGFQPIGGTIASSYCSVTLEFTES